MKICVEVPEYRPADGFRFVWEDGFLLQVVTDGDAVILRGNAPGLVSLARHLLALARPDHAGGHHFHLDESNSLEAGSIELIVERIPDPVPS